MMTPALAHAKPFELGVIALCKSWPTWLNFLLQYLIDDLYWRYAECCSSFCFQIPTASSLRPQPLRPTPCFSSISAPFSEVDVSQKGLPSTLALANEMFWSQSWRIQLWSSALETFFDGLRQNFRKYRKTNTYNILNFISAFFKARELKNSIDLFRLLSFCSNCSSGYTRPASGTWHETLGHE